MSHLLLYLFLIVLQAGKKFAEEVKKDLAKGAKK